jgi:hypothetical protein
MNFLYAILKDESSNSSQIFISKILELNMKLVGFIKFCLAFSLIYVSVGDTFLPQPYKANSKKVRADINEYLIGLFPEPKLDNLKRTEQTFKNFEQGKLNSHL